MNRLELFLTLCSISFQAVLCAVVFARRVQRTLPLFATYASALLLSSVCVFLAYMYFGFDSATSYYVFWASTYLYGVAWGLAIAELCRYELRRYRGIWELAWRVLAVLAVLLTAHAAADAKGQPNGIGIFGATFLRDVAFSSIVILSVLLLIRRYYGLSLAPLQRLVAIGMCVTCSVDVVGYTVFRNFLAGRAYSWSLKSQQNLWPALAPIIRRMDDLWSTIHLITFMFAMGLWCYAFRKPLPASAGSPVLLPAEAAREMSADVNERLATFNDRLLDLLKP